MKSVSIILTFIAVFNWNTILIEYGLMKETQKDLQARAFGWKHLKNSVISRFIEARLAFLLPIAECKLIATRLSLSRRISFFFFFLFSHLFVRSRKLVATFFIRAGREHLEHRRLVTTTAPMMASPSMLSRKRGWSSWKNTSAKVRRNWSAPMEPTFHARLRIVGNERDF